MEKGSSSRPLEDAVDPLREGLCLFARQFGRQASVAELGDGLALEQGRLPRSLVPKALRRIGLTARVLQRQIGNIPASLLPALLLLRDGRTLLLIAVDDDQAVVLSPETGGGQQHMSIAELASLHGGMVVFAKPAYRPDERAGDYGRALPEHWLRGDRKSVV